MNAMSTYPFRPKSTASLIAGEFWAVPLPDGRFACGRILQLQGSEIPTPSQAYFGGLQNWVGKNLPTSESIAGSEIIAFGVMHIKAITELGGEVLGYRTLEFDKIKLPTLLSALGGPSTKVLCGANAIRNAARVEWGKWPVLEFWGCDFIVQVAVEHFVN